MVRAFLLLKVAFCNAVLCAAVLWQILWFAPLQSATLERLSLDDMILKSTGIVRGRVTGSYTAFRGSLIYTHLRVQVSERWKGPDSASIEVMIPGGAVGQAHQSFSGVPHLAEGKEYVLFLWTGKTGITHVIGFTQGVFALAQTTGSEAMLVRSPTLETLLDPGTGQPVGDERLELKLRDLRARVASTLSKGAVE